MRNGTRGPDNGKTQRNDKKLTSSGFKHQQICTPLPPTTKPPTKLLALTDPILALENLVKTLCNCYKNSKLSKTRSQKWKRLAAQKMNVKSPNPQQRRPVQETKNYNCVNSSTCKVGTRGGPANPDFNWTFRPQKWNLKAHMWHQLSQFSGSKAICDQNHPDNIHQSFASPLLRALFSSDSDSVPFFKFTLPITGLTCKDLLSGLKTSLGGAWGPTRQ